MPILYSLVFSWLGKPIFEGHPKKISLKMFFKSVFLASQKSGPTCSNQVEVGCGIYGIARKKTLFFHSFLLKQGYCSRVPQRTCIWMSLPGASGLGEPDQVTDADQTWNIPTVVATTTKTTRTLRTNPGGSDTARTSSEIFLNRKMTTFEGY